MPKKIKQAAPEENLHLRAWVTKEVNAHCDRLGFDIDEDDLEDCVDQVTQSVEDGFQALLESTVINVVVVNDEDDDDDDDDVREELDFNND